MSALLAAWLDMFFPSTFFSIKGSEYLYLGK